MGDHGHHDHGHHDHGHHDHGDHDHGPGPFQPDHPDVESEERLLARALRDLLIEKGVIAPDEITRMIDFFDSRGTHLGARIAALAWTDSGFRERLLADASAAIGELGIPTGSLPLYVVENTPAVHNMVVCTLCSCYPRVVLGRPPAWYKSKAYRSRAVYDGRNLLAEFGYSLPDSTELRVHDSTAELRYLVLPLRPAGTEGWSAERLEALITRDSLIGVAPALAPV